jgi:ribonuclease P protein component
VRRLLKEIARLTNIKPGLDIVFIARPNAATADYHQLKKSMEKLLLRAQLVDKNETLRVGVN